MHGIPQRRLSAHAARRWLVGVVMVALLASPMFVMTASAWVVQVRYPTFQGCTIEPTTIVDNAAGGNPPVAYSKAYNPSGCAALVRAQSQWCKNYYCETSTLEQHAWLAEAYKYAVGQSTIDIGRGRSWHAVPWYGWSGADYSGDLAP